MTAEESQQIELAGGPFDGRRISAPVDAVSARVALFGPEGAAEGEFTYLLAGRCADGTPLYRYVRVQGEGT